MLSSMSWDRWLEYLNKLILPATFTTLYMIATTMILAVILGFGLSILLTLYGPAGINPNEKVYRVLDFAVNTIRSFPMLILIVAIIPITRAILGTIIGPTAAVIPLTVAATAFIGRLFENNFREVDEQLIEAARSFGASNIQIMFKVIVKESIPSMVNSITVTAITFTAGTVVAGVVGGGGLGAVALNYGFQSFNDVLLYTCVIVLFIIVMIIQNTGNLVYKKLTK
jgi:D-methionine transport system permease protein